MAFTTRTVTMAAGDDGELVEVELLICEMCDCGTWQCFLVSGQQHSHFKCAGCGTCYCPDGLC